MSSTAFGKFAGASAAGAAVATLLYAIAFVVLDDAALSALALTVLGLLASVVAVGLYDRLRHVEPAFALWAVALGLAGALGGMLHGGFDLANAINPPAAAPPDLPFQVDPRGLLTFGATGLSLAVVGWLMGRGAGFPRGLSYMAYLAAALLLVLYLGRLIILDAKDPVIAVPAVISGFIVSPVFYAWLGLSLWRESPRGAVVGRPATHAG